MINIQDIIPFMKDGWVAMDKGGYWWWYSRKPVLIVDNWTCTSLCCEEYQLHTFDIAPADDWIKSLIKVGGK